MKTYAADPRDYKTISMRIEVAFCDQLDERARAMGVSRTELVMAALRRTLEDRPRTVAVARPDDEPAIVRRLPWAND